MWITPKIYKIDNYRVQEALSNLPTNNGVTFTTREIPNIIFQYHENRRLVKELETWIRFHNKRLEIDEINFEWLDFKWKNIAKTLYVSIYMTGSALNSHPLMNFFSDISIDELSWKTIPNTAIFLIFDDSCYAISVGSGYIFFEAFIDNDFPIKLARQIMNPEVLHTQERDITWIVYWRIQQFRTNQLVESQSIWTIWNLLDGEVIENVRDSGEFKSIFKKSNRTKVGMVASSFLTIKSVVDSEWLIRSLLWLDRKYRNPLTPLQKKNFEQLDGIIQINPRKKPDLPRRLDLQLAKDILDSLLTWWEIDFDFSHPDFLLYKKANCYRFRQNNHSKLVGTWDDAPTAQEVLTKAFTNNILNTWDADAFLEDIKKVYFIAENINKNDSVFASLIDCLHGEIKYNDTTYFRIDREWYQLNRKFKGELKDRFTKLLTESFFLTTGLPMVLPWPATVLKEGDYNELYKTENNYIVADRALLHNNLELADLIHFDKDTIFLYHNKVGFGASTRDVCSQVLQSMTWLERIRKSDDRKELSDYYDKIKTKHYSSGTPLLKTKTAFVDRLLKIKSGKICYVIWYAKSQPITNASRSDIAKFETIKLCTFDKRTFDFDLKIQHIHKA